MEFKVMCPIRLPGRVELDKTRLRALGVSDDKIDEIINEIYD